mgnify:CR=1 FL=1
MIALSKPYIGEAEKIAVLRVLESGMIAQGPEVEAFEEEFSKTVCEHQCIAVNSGTSALHLGLLAAGIRPGDEVIVPSFTFAATANAVSLCGATPVFVDIDLKTFTIDVDAIRAAITTKTTGIMPVHLYGHPARMDLVSEIAEKHGLLLFEDAAQAHLAEYQNSPVGTFGTSAFSFYPTKNMTSAEGGMIVTSDPEIARTAKLLRNQGMERKYENEIVGFNNRMTDINAAIGRVQLESLEKRTKRRREIAKIYDENLLNVTTPFVGENVLHAYHQYTIKSQNRDSLSSYLSEKEVGNGVYYPTPVHQLPSFDLTLDLPNTNIATKEVLSIPVHPFLSDEEIETVIEVINTWT